MRAILSSWILSSIDQKKTQKQSTYRVCNQNVEKTGTKPERMLDTAKDYMNNLRQRENFVERKS